MTRPQELLTIRQVFAHPVPVLVALGIALVLFLPAVFA